MSNAVCNNAAFSPPTILFMAGEDIHESAARLYGAAKRLVGVTGKSAIARLLNESPQVVNNWETRGVSEGGALKAQKAIGCSATWILTGEGAELPNWPFSSELQQKVLKMRNPEEVIRLENVMRLHLRMPLKTEVPAEESGLTQVTSRSSPLTESVESSQQLHHSGEDEHDSNGYSAGRRGSAPKRRAALEEAGRYAEDGNGSSQDQRTTRGKGGGRH